MQPGWEVTAEAMDGSPVLLGTYATEEEANAVAEAYNDEHVPGWRDFRTVWYANHHTDL